MKLRHHLLLWFVVVSVLPLILLLFMANHYDRQQYLNEIDQELHGELDRLIASLEQQLARHRNLVASLGRSPAIDAFGRALQEVSQQGSLTWQYSHARRQLEQLFVDLQPLIPERAVIRLLDSNGNTVIKAQFVETASPTLESLPPYPLYELEPEAGLSKQLQALPPNDISYIRYPGHPADSAPNGRRTLLDAVWPVQTPDWRLYLLFSSMGERLDKLMALTPRLRGGEITVVEYDATRPEQSRILFSDRGGVRFSNSQPVQMQPLPGLIKAYETQPSGLLEMPQGQGRWYYQDYYPYPDRLISWIVAIRLDLTELSSRNQATFYGLLGLGAFNLLLGLLLAGYASRRLAQPIVRLAQNMRDYAQGKPLQADMDSLSSEVGQLQASFRHMTQTLEDSQREQARAEKQLVLSAKLASIGEMAAGIGHELNNPLTNILTLGKLAKRTADISPDLNNDIDEIIDEARRASRIVRGILDFARQGNLEVQQLLLCDAVGQALERVERQAYAKQLDIQADCHRRFSVSADPFQLRQVLLNLLENAIYASPAKGRITIVGSEQDDMAVLRIHDEGAGIETAASERLFEPFFTTKKVGEGSGLGLSISLGIVEMHGGRLNLYNHPQGGCVAEVRLPLCEAVEHA